MPINRTFPLAEVMAAARAYAETTGRKVTFEYVVVPGLNDTPDQARRLAALLKGFPSLVNLLPQHPGGAGRPDPTAATAFAERLTALGLEAAVRRSRGAEVLGACGQLRDRSPE